MLKGVGFFFLVWFGLAGVFEDCGLGFGWVDLGWLGFGDIRVSKDLEFGFLEVWILVGHWY